MVNVIIIVLLRMAYGKIARKLTKWENHKTASGYADSLIIKIFA